MEGSLTRKGEGFRRRPSGLTLRAMSDRQPATLRRIADECGVSMTTVSKIMRGRFKGNTRKGRASVEAVTGAARRLGYLPNGSAQRLRGGRHRAVAVLVSVDRYGHPEAITFEYITGLAAVLAPARYSLTLHTYPRNQTEAAVGRLTERNFDAVVALDETGPELDRFLSAAAIPAVHINTEPARGRAALTWDDRASAKALTEVLIGLGYRDLLLVGSGSGGMVPHGSTARRLEGIREACAGTGTTVTDTGLTTWYADFDTEFARRLPLPPSTVVVTITSMAALRCLRCLPTGHPIAACDDAHLFNSVAPWLTRVAYDRASMGRLAADYLLQRLDDPKATLAIAPQAGSVLVGASTPRLAAAPAR